MASLENYQLMHPELLTEDALRQVLADRCIRVSVLKSSDKTQLVEMFKRVAMPLPQRSCNDARHLGRKLIGSTKIKRQREALPSLTLGDDGSCPGQGERVVDSLEPPRAGEGTETKRNSLSQRYTRLSIVSRDANKRTSQTAALEQSGRNKRQKITWP